MSIETTESMKPEIQSLLTDEEVIALIKACGSKHNIVNFVIEKEVIALIDWAEDIRRSQTLLELVLKGRLKVRMEHGELKFGTE